jgi:hypothetical protein
MLGALWVWTNGINSNQRRGGRTQDRGLTLTEEKKKKKIPKRNSPIGFIFITDLKFQIHCSS